MQVVSLLYLQTSYTYHTVVVSCFTLYKHLPILEDAYFLKSCYHAKFYDPALSGTESKCVGCSGMILGFHESLSDGQNLLVVRRAWCMDMIPVTVLLMSLCSEKCSQQILLAVLSFYVTDKVHEPLKLNMIRKGTGHMLQQIILWIILVFHRTAMQNGLDFVFLIDYHQFLSASCHF
jgi:hypothetical protein